MNNAKKDSTVRLLELGFQEVGEWKLANGKLTFILTQNASQTNFLYAFVANDVVKYIGKSAQTFEQRMMGYKNPGPSQRTNIRNHEKIIDSLNVGQSVEILVFCPSESLSFRGYRVNLAAGLEDTLIDALSPEWNILSR